MKTTLKGLLLLATMLVLAGGTAQAAIDTAKVQKLLAQDGTADDRFGYSVAVSGDTAVIGAMGDDNYKGSAYVFTRSTDGTWSQQAKLVAADGASIGFSGDSFGRSVSVSGDTAVIGAFGDDNRKGSAYVFTRTNGTWSQQAKLTAADGADADRFGVSVSVSGDTTVIGAFGDDTEKGAVYVFTRTDGVWSQQTKLAAADGAAYDWFGWSVSLSGDTVLVGTCSFDSSDDIVFVTAGSAYVFTRINGTWGQQAKITAADEAATDGFGWSVSLSGDTALIGAMGDDNYKGSAYVFTRTGSTWSQQANLLSVDGVSSDNFGYSVSVDGDTAIIGANGDDSHKGSAYVFTRINGTWSQQAKLLSADGVSFDNFGCSVSVDGDTAVIGALGDDERKGAAYVFGGPSITHRINMAPVYNLLLKR